MELFDSKPSENKNEEIIAQPKKSSAAKLFIPIAGSILVLLVAFFLAKIFYPKPQYKIISAKIKSNSVIMASFLENGLSREAAHELTFSIEKVLDLRKLRAGENYKIFLDKNNVVQKFIYHQSPYDLYYAVRTAKGFSCFKEEVNLAKKVYSKTFTLKSSLFQAVLDKKEKEPLVFDIVDIFSFDIDFNTFPRQGDKIKVLYEKYEHQNKFAKYGKIIAAQYISNDKIFSGLLFESRPKKWGYYDLSGKPTEKQFLKSPLKFTGRITSLFSSRRFHPIIQRVTTHYGVDFASYYGAPIVATASGRIVFSGWKGAYGRAVIVRHANNFQSLYGHCSRILTRAGASVEQGQIIAQVGSTGWSTGPHVHYGVEIKGAPINPLALNNQPKEKPLYGKTLAKYQRIKNKILALLNQEINGEKINLTEIYR